MTFYDLSYPLKLHTPVTLLPSSFTLFCSTRNRCGEIMKLLWLLWGWSAGRSQHFSSILCPRAKETEHHRRLYIVSIIFYDTNPFRRMYWAIQHWEDYVVPRCHRLSSRALQQSVHHWLSQNFKHPGFFCLCHTAYTHKHIHIRHACCNCNPSRTYARYIIGMWTSYSYSYT